MALDIFDEIELSAEDKIFISEEFKKILVDRVRIEMKKAESEFKKFIKLEIGNIPKDRSSEIMGVVISKRIDATKLQFSKELTDLKIKTNEIEEKSKNDVSSAKKEIDKINQDLRNELKSDLESFTKKIKDEEESFVEKLRKKYDSLRNEILSQPTYTFGGYPPPGGVLPIQSGGVDTWRIIIDGDDLSFQYNDSGTWTEAYRVTRNQ